MSADRAIDVRHLPNYAFGHRNLMWWGTVLIMAIEGSVFVLAFVTYFYLRGRVPEWPPNVYAPGLFWGTVNTVILLASGVPNHLTKRAAEREDLGGTRLWLGVSLVFGAAFTLVRAFEFGSLNVRWDANAYGSIVWTLLGLHTFHVVTDVLDSIVLFVMLLVEEPSGTRFSDTSDNALYWWFVVLSWLPFYGVIYLGPWLL